jgi:hypothetical protein
VGTPWQVSGFMEDEFAIFRADPHGEKLNSGA